MSRQAYPKYKPSGVEWLGELPEHWEVKRLKHLCQRSALYGANESAASYSEEGIRFLRTTDITENGDLADEGVYLESKLVRDYILTDGDLLISRSGTIGRTFLYDYTQHGACAYAGYLVRFVPGSSALPRFLFYYLKSRNFEQWIAISVIASTIGNVNGQKYANMYIARPPVREQHAIAAFLDRETERNDALIAKKQRQIELLQEKRSALISHVVTKGLDPNVKMKDSGIEWLGQIPEHWEVCRLKYSVDLINQKVDGSDSELPYMGLEHIESWTGKIISPNGDVLSEGQSNLYQRGDVLFGKLRPYLAKVHAAETSGICTGELLVLRPKAVQQKFLLNYLLNPDVISIVDSSTYGAKMPRANWDFIGNIPVLISPTEEQRAIAAFLDRDTVRIDALIEKVEKSTDLLREYRTALISAAVTGKIDIRKEVS